MPKGLNGLAAHTWLIQLQCTVATRDLQIWYEQVECEQRMQGLFHFSTPSLTRLGDLLQAATEQAARALALYAKDAQELRDQLAQAQAQAESRRTGSFATILKSARRSFLRQNSSAAAPEEVTYLHHNSFALFDRGIYMIH